MSKRIIALILAVITVFSVCAISANAATTVKTTNYNSQYCECRLSNPGKKDAKVTITVVGFPWQSTNVTFKDANGRYIWSESNAIKIGKISLKGSRTFNLGKDHYVYRIYVNNNATFSNPKNCTIKIK